MYYTNNVIQFTSSTCSLTEVAASSLSAGPCTPCSQYNCGQSLVLSQTSTFMMYFLTLLMPSSAEENTAEDSLFPPSSLSRTLPHPPPKHITCCRHTFITYLWAQIKIWVCKTSRCQNNVSQRRRTETEQSNLQ